MDNIINKFSSLKIKKGKQCSVNGKKYEQEVYDCIKSVRGLNVQKIGGCSAKNDLQCEFAAQSFGIEVKKCGTPDWMQCSIKPVNEFYQPSKRSMIPRKSRALFAELIRDKKIFDKIPPFIEQPITHVDWCKIKHEYKDVYIDIPDDTISKMYAYKGCNYIQISDYGLYHTGNDICKLNVPQFIIPQHIRIRIKVHKKCKKNGYCGLSIIAACKPKNIKTLEISKYSLDNIDLLPDKFKIKH